EIIPDQATGAIETTLSSLMRTMWFLCDLTPSGSISTWEDLTTCFLAQFFPPGRTVEIRNDILMFQQHQEKDKDIENNMIVDKNIIGLSKSNAIKPKEEVDMKKKVEDKTSNEPIRSMKEEITEKDKDIENNIIVDKNIIGLSESNAIKPKEEVDMKKKVEDKTSNEPIMSMKEEITVDIKDEVVSGTTDEPVRNVMEDPKELVEMPRLQPVGYYLKHEINEKLIEGLVGNQRYNDSLLATRL
nr:zinc finger, CCHC-type [Tanacetum cinerariifolium]